LQEIEEKVMALRKQSNLLNIHDTILGLALMIYAIWDFWIVDVKGERILLGALVLTCLSIFLFLYKYCTNLPLPTEKSEKSLIDYQISQLSRFIKASETGLWWNVLPLLNILLGILVLKKIQDPNFWVYFALLSVFVVYIFLYVEMPAKKWRIQFRELEESL
jgi:hypothetical protein